MTMDEKYSKLIGYSRNRKKELHSLKEVALFISNEGMHADVSIYTELGDFLLDTYGLYINKISDMDYREALLEVLVPMQLETEKRCILCETKADTLKRRINEYLDSEEYVNEFEAERMKYTKSGTAVPPDEKIRDILIEKKTAEIQTELDF